MREKRSVLITCVGGGLSFQLIEQLKSSQIYDYFVLGVDIADDVVTRHACDVFVTVPSADESSYTDHILEISKKYGVELIFPCSDLEALILARDRKKFEAHDIIVACNDYEALLTISNKAKTYEMLEELGIRTPFWKQTNSLSEINELVQNQIKISKSVVVKLPSARGSRGIFVLDEKIKGQHFYNHSREIHSNPQVFLNDTLPNLNPEHGYIVMERLFEPVCDLDILAWNGTVVHALPRRRLESANPNNGHIIEKNEEIIKIAKIIIQKMCLSWIFDIDYMFATDGHPIILEINPRASGSVAVPIVAGVPLFDDMFKLLRGERVGVDRYPYKTVVYPIKSLRKRVLL